MGDTFHPTETTGFFFRKKDLFSLDFSPLADPHPLNSAQSSKVFRHAPSFLDGRMFGFSGAVNLGD